MGQSTFSLRFIELNDGKYQVRLTSPVGQATEPCDLTAVSEWLRLAREFIPDDREVWRSVDIGAVGARVRQRAGGATKSLTERMGEALFRAVFHGQIALLFERTRGLAVATGQPTTIQFDFELQDPVQARLATLPWEALRDPDRLTYLAQSEETPVVRFLRFDGTVRRVRLPQVLRVLAVTSTPDDLPALNVSSALEPVKGWPQANIVVEHLANPCPSQLRKALNRGANILHFDGHGRFSPDSGIGELALVREKTSEASDSKAEWISGGTLARSLLNQPGLRLVVLNSCDGGAQGGEEAFGGVAAALVKGGVASVIAMQRIIPDGQAVVFSRTLYERLTAGHPVEASLSAARHELAILGGDHWTTPVLYTSTDEIFSVLADVRPTLTRVFSWLGVVTANVAVNAWSKSQGGPSLPGLGFNEVHEESVPILGLVTVAPLLLLLLWVILRYQSVSRERGLYFRLPIAFGLPIEASRKLANFFQSTMLVILVAVPLASQAHFMTLIYQGSSWDKTQPHCEFASEWSHWQRFESPIVVSDGSPRFKDRYRFGPKKKGGERNSRCTGSPVCEVSFFPFWQPWVHLVLSLTALLMFLSVLHGIWSRDPQILRRRLLRKRVLIGLFVVLAAAMTVSAVSGRSVADRFEAMCTELKASELSS